MRQEWILRSLARRLTDRWNGALVLLVGGMFCIFRALDSRHPVVLLEWAFPFAAIYLHLALAPLPWQWAAGKQGGGAQLRGLFLAVVFNAAWVAALFFAFRSLRPVPPPPPAWSEGGPSHHAHPRGPDPGWGLGLMNVAFAIVVGWVLAEKERMEARERRTAGLLRQAEAKALQNQLDPHVLYNALSGLSELIREDPLAAEEVITQLADLYRRLTLHGTRERVALGEERRLVEAYLAMEQMRLGDRLRAEWTWPEWADGTPVPPLFLLTLVENAIKHGISPCEAGGDVRIACGRVGERLELMVENTGRPLDPAVPRGVGLSNLEARLRLLADPEAAFDLESRGEWTVARLRWAPEGRA
ncbi:sensor histidine kinase [Geothrix sp. 21YS21S-4]|uniref:sensor histidine kinase n=1 Tax=Geothrix sp. 21YS21S-4 TaxID=3068889 RepID=UPI0027B89933|nr:histidine kinase [Geothrix sp. 21YS21S-4]